MKNNNIPPIYKDSEDTPKKQTVDDLLFPGYSDEIINAIKSGEATKKEKQEFNGIPIGKDAYLYGDIKNLNQDDTTTKSKRAIEVGFKFIF